MAETSENPASEGKQDTSKGSGRLRRAVDGDIEQLVELVKSNRDKLLPRSADDFRELLELTWVVDDGGRIVGCATLEVYSPKIAEIRNVAVDASERGKGYGKILVRAAVDEANKRKVREIIVVTSNREFFEGLNFGACLNEKYVLFWSGT